MLLSDLAKKQCAVVCRVAGADDDQIAGRLRDLGFVPGETLQIAARAPFGGDPLLVRIGATRFALRKAEAQRVEIELR